MSDIKVAIGQFWKYKNKQQSHYLMTIQDIELTRLAPNIYIYDVFCDIVNSQGERQTEFCINEHSVYALFDFIAHDEDGISHFMNSPIEMWQIWVHRDQPNTRMRIDSKPFYEGNNLVFKGSLMMPNTEEAIQVPANISLENFLTNFVYNGEAYSEIIPMGKSYG